VCHAYRFFADPYDARTVYVLDEDGVKESNDAGHSWHQQPELTRWVLDNGNSPPHCIATCAWSDDDSPLTYMLFVPGEPRTRFAMGVNGVFMSSDGTSSSDPSAHTERWHRLLDPTTLPCLANRAFFDVSGNPRRTLYIGCVQRGVVALTGIPAPNR
jgi:hypothetical protein